MAGFFVVDDRVPVFARFLPTIVSPLVCNRSESQFRSNSSTIPETFRLSLMAATFVSSITCSSIMTSNGFLPAGARGPLLLFGFFALLVFAINAIRFGLSQ
jgi:hypothetical protein